MRLLLLVYLPLLALASLSPNSTSVLLPFRGASLLSNMLLFHNESVLVVAYDSQINTPVGQIFSIDATAPEMKLLSNFSSGTGYSYFVATSDSSMIYLRVCNEANRKLCTATFIFHEVFVSSTGELVVGRTLPVRLNATVGVFMAIPMTFIPSQNVVVTVGQCSAGYCVNTLDLTSFTLSMLGVAIIPPGMHGEVAVDYGIVGPAGDYVVLSWVQSVGPVVMAKYTLNSTAVSLVNYSMINSTGYAIPVLLSGTNMGFYMAEEHISGDAFLTNFDFAAWKSGAIVRDNGTTVGSNSEIIAVSGHCIYTSSPSVQFEATKIAQYRSSIDLQTAQEQIGQMVLHKFSIEDDSPMIASSEFLYVPVTTVTKAFIMRWEATCVNENAL